MTFRSILLTITRAGLVGFAVFSLIVLLIAIVLTPQQLWIVKPWFTPEDWIVLSSIGQAYGAASAVLSGLALLFVGISIAVQVSDARASREQSMRMLHLELMRMSLDDPLYLECWGDFSSSANPDIRRQHIYTNLIVSHWQTAFEIGYLKDDGLKALATNFFAGEVGRDFWRDSRQARIASVKNTRSRIFIDILDKNYSEAIQCGEPGIKRRIWRNENIQIRRSWRRASNTHTNF